MIGHHTIILSFGVFSFMGWYGTAISSRKIIKEVGFHKKYYPKRYIMPSRRFRKFFKLKKIEIPKWLYLEFCMSFVYIGLFVAFLLSYLLFNKAIVFQAFIWIYAAVMGIDMLHLMICLFLYR